MRNFLDAPAAIYSTVWLSSVSSFSIAGLLKALASGFLVSVLFSLISRKDDESLAQNVGGTGVDIPAHQRAEDALREAENKYRDIFENAVEGIFQTTPDGHFITANPALARMLGYDSTEELLSCRTDIAQQHYVDPALRLEFKQMLEEDGVVRDFEHRAYRKDGRMIWLSENVRSVCDANGKVLYYEGFTEDITARKRSEESLGLFRSLIDQSNDAIEVLDPSTLRFLDCNTTAHQTLGYTREEFLALTAFDIDPIIDEPTLARLGEAMDKSAFAIFESVHRRKDGSTFPVEINAKTIGLERDYRLAVVRDITERKRAEKALQESEERFRQLSEAAFEAILLHDQGTILEVNQSFCRIYGYERAEVIGKSVLDLTLPELREPLQERMRLGGTSPYEGLALRKDGTTFRAELAGKPIHYQGRVVRVAAIRDITEQRRNERRQAAQYAVTRVLAESATLAEATPQLLQVICESLRWKMGEFWRVCDSTNLLRCVETWQVPALQVNSFVEASRQMDLAPGVGLPGLVWQSGQPMWIPDVTTDARFVRPTIAAKVDLRCAVAFPILLGNHTLGVMLFLSSRTPEVDEELLKIMSAIGSQIGQFAERKQIEGALRESEERYRDLVENSREFICTHDLNGLILSANRAASEVLGYDLKDFCGMKNFRDLLVPEVRDQFDDYLARIRRDGVASGLTLVQTSAGERRILEYHNTVRTEGVATPIVRGMARDITERREAEKALRVSEQKYRDIFSLAPLGICQSLPDGTLITANKALATMLGYDSVDELLKLKLDSDVYYVAGERQKLITKYEPGGHAVDLEFQLKRKDGSPFWVQMDAHAVRGPGGSTEYFEAFVRDITERKRAEEALRESEERYRELFENAKDTIYVHDLNGIYTSVNRAAEQLTGYSREEIIGKHFSDFLAPEYLPRVRNHLGKKLTEQRPASFEVEVIGRDGRRVPVELSSNVVREDGVPVGVQGIARDITERKRAAELLQTFPRRLIEAQEAERKRIARELHDEIGQVLTAVSLNLQAVRASGLTPTSTPKIDESILVVDDALLHVQNLALELRPSLLDDLGLAAAIRWFVDRYAQRTGIKAEVTMDVQIADGRLSRELETACFRIVQEALTNVARHAEAQTVSIHLRALSNEIRISIKDDGVGFDAAAGNGAAPFRLGLRGMEERALALGGKLEIKSARARGTEILAYFPNENKKD